MSINKKSDNYTIEAIAYMVGFYSKSSFSTVFRKQIGITPSDYKNQCSE
jgi:two-component system response regulator YesN